MVRIARSHVSIIEQHYSDRDLIQLITYGMPRRIRAAKPQSRFLPTGKKNSR